MGFSMLCWFLVGHLIAGVMAQKAQATWFCFKFSGSSLAAIKPIFSGDITERLSL